MLLPIMLDLTPILKRNYNMNSARENIKSSLQPMRLVWALINLIYDLLFILTCRVQLQLIIKKSDVADAMDYLLTAFYYLMLPTKKFRNILLHPVNPLKLIFVIFYSTLKIQLFHCDYLTLRAYQDYT